LGDIDPEALRRAIAESRSWAQVQEKLRMARPGRNYARLRAIAEAIGADTGSLYGQAWSSAPIEALPVPFANSFDPALLRRMGQAVATAWFRGRGYVASIPAEPSCYDLVVESDAGLRRVQVKTTNNGGANITKTQYGIGTSPSTGKYGSRPYAPEEIDFFFILTGTGAMYLIPIDAVAGKRAIELKRYIRYKLPDLCERPYSNLAERSG
jgi:hypothetical protein